MTGGTNNAATPKVRRWRAALAARLCGGVYAAGFAATQARHETAISRLFAALDRLEALLSDGRPFLLGAGPTEPDWHLFCTGVRFNVAYHGALRCNLRRYGDYDRLTAHVTRCIHEGKCLPRTDRLPYYPRPVCVTMDRWPSESCDRKNS